MYIGEVVFYLTGEPILLGDWVKVFAPKLGVWHHGIVRRIYPVPGGCAVDIAHSMKASGVALSDWHVFADANVVMLVEHAASAAHVNEILDRVDANIGKPYALFEQNCEHFASFAFTGKAESASVNVVGGLTAAVILAAWLLGE